MSGNAGKQERIEMVLAAQPFLVMIERRRQSYLVARRAELRVFVPPGTLVERLQESRLVEFGLCLDELVVDPLQGRVIGVSERIMLRLLDGVVGVPCWSVDVRHRMTNDARDSGMCRRVIDVVEVGLVKRPRVERHRVVTAGAPPRR